KISEIKVQPSQPADRKPSSSQENKPASGTSTEPKARTQVTIKITGKCEYSLDGKKVSLEELDTLLEKLAKKDAENLQVMVKVDEKALWGSVTSVLDLFNKLRITAYELKVTASSDADDKPAREPKSTDQTTAASPRDVVHAWLEAKRAGRSEEARSLC